MRCIYVKPLCKGINMTVYLEEHSEKKSPGQARPRVKLSAVEFKYDTKTIFKCTSLDVVSTCTNCYCFWLTWIFLVVWHKLPFILLDQKYDLVIKSYNMKDYWKKSKKVFNNKLSFLHIYKNIFHVYKLNA